MCMCNVTKTPHYMHNFVYCLLFKSSFESRHEKTNRYDTNRVVQGQKMAFGLEGRGIVLSISRKNRGPDQLRS